MKSDVIYCFSGTGNSLYVAKEIAKATGGEVELIKKSIFKKELNKDYNRLGIVFPVYHQGLPVMVDEFIKMLRGVEVSYLYGVSTYGDKPTLALKYLKNRLKDQNMTLDFGSSVRMPYNYLRPSKIGKGMYASFSVKVPNEKKCHILYNEATSKIQEINDIVKEKITGNVELSDRFIENLVDKLNLRDTLQKKQWLKIAGYKGKQPDTFFEAIALMDTNFSVSEKCSSCGLCALVCPSENISYKDNKPVWNHHCQQCMACFHWCRQGAINYGVSSNPLMQYHHPQIMLKDIINEEIKDEYDS